MPGRRVGCGGAELSPGLRVPDSLCCAHWISMRCAIGRQNRSGQRCGPRPLWGAEVLSVTPPLWSVARQPSTWTQATRFFGDHVRGQGRRRWDTDRGSLCLSRVSVDPCGFHLSLLAPATFLDPRAGPGPPPPQQPLCELPWGLRISRHHRRPTSRHDGHSASLTDPSVT